MIMDADILRPMRSHPRPKRLHNTTRLALVEFPRISVEEMLDKPAETSTSRFNWDIFGCFPFARSNVENFDLHSEGYQTPRYRISKPPSIPPFALPEMTAQVEARPYAWPIAGTFDPATTALVVIDMQKDFCTPGGYLEHQGYDISFVLAIIPRIQHLLNIFRAHNFPIFHTREGHRPDLSTLSPRELTRSRMNPSGLGIGDAGPLGRLLVRGEKGHEIVDELKPWANEPIVDKPGRSAFQHTDLGLMLRCRGVKNLVLVGVTTDVCVSSTMRDANDNAFDCLLVEDATAASERYLHEGAVGSIIAEGGIFGAVSTTEDILRSLGEEYRRN